MKWCTIDSKYLDYLRNYEGRIPKIDYGDNKLKPFFGSLFEVGELVYVTQVSHPQKRHNYLKDNKDFIKLYYENKLIAVVNLNYMFPVHKNRITEIKYQNIENFIQFESVRLKNGYITLLKREMKEIKRKKVREKALGLYKLKYEYPRNRVSLRCVDFKKLEQKCLEYELIE